MTDAPPVALVTGAASGIGLGVSQHLARQGYRLIVTDLNAEAAQQVAAQLSADTQCHALTLDVTRDDHIENCRDFVEQQCGRMDLLVNNAGIQHVARLEDFPADTWRLINSVLLVGPALLSRALLPLMKRNNRGRIVNIGSIHSLVASPYKSAYVAAKHGLLGFAKTVALECAEFDITINTICPAYVRTALVDKQIADQAAQHGISEEEVINKIMLAPMPKQSFIGIDEISGAIEFLCSPAAKNMTGQEIVLDGGWTAR